MTRHACYFTFFFWYLYVYVQVMGDVVYLSATRSEAFVLRTVQKHEFQHKIKYRYKQKCMFSIYDHGFQ